MDVSGWKLEGRYRGSCNCGAVQFDFGSPLDAPFRCGCSYCQSHGAILHEVPASAVRVLGGEHYLISYDIHHFCKRCGVFAFTRASNRTHMTVNLRCVDALSTSFLTPLPLADCS